MSRLALLLLLGVADGGVSFRAAPSALFVVTDSSARARPGPEWITVNRSDGGTISLSTDDLFDLIVWTREAKRIGCLHAPGAK